MNRRNKPKQITKTRSKSKSYIGYCHSREHKGFLTAAIIKEHNCMHKAYIDENGNTVYRECKQLEKLNTSFWVEKERAKLYRKMHKEAKKLGLSIKEVDETIKRYKYNEERIRKALGLT